MIAKVGQIRLTSTYALLERFRRMNYPQIVKKLKRTPANVQKLKDHASKTGIEILDVVDAAG